MATSINQLLRKEKSISDFVPYTVHVSPENVRLSGGDMLTIIKVDGVAHQTANVEDVQLWHDQLNNLYRNVADPKIALWRTMIRREQDIYPGGEFRPGFAQVLNEKWRKVVTKEKMRVNDHYLTIILRGENQASQLFSTTKRTQLEVTTQLAEQSAALDDLAATFMAALSDYSPQRLSIYERAPAPLTLGGPKTYSAPAEFLSFLLNGKWAPIPVPRQRMCFSLPVARLTFGVDTGQIRSVDETELFAMLGANEYPEETVAGDLNELMSLPFDMVVTQSYCFFDRTKALEMVADQERKLINTGDAAKSQVSELALAKDDLAAGRIAYGDHHLNVLIKASDAKTLAEHIARLRQALSNSDFQVVREDLTLEAAYFAQLPGNFRWRPRKGLISSKNAAGLMSMHNFPQGKADNNQWGPALALLKTTSGTPYFFNMHLPTRGKRADGSQSDDERVAGNTLLIGPTGAGKTVVQAFLVAMADKYQPTVFTYDKDYGQEIFIRAMGGVYTILRKGEPSGLNPLMQSDTPRNVLFVEDLIQKLVLPHDRALSADEEFQISTAVRAVMAMPKQMRRFETLRSFFPESPDGINARLLKWCAGQSLGWALDNPSDNLTLGNTQYFGFDMTEVLDDKIIRTPVVMYLFHRMEELIDRNNPFILNMDEFWKMLDDSYFEVKANDVLKTIRKRDGVALLGTQSPKDALNSRIAHTLIEQCVTKLFLPNPAAEEEQYVHGFKLSRREFLVVKQDMPLARLRGFLVKQGLTSAVCELNLAGFDDELAVLSGTTASVEICRRAIAHAGNDPSDWLPLFHQMRKEKK
ncbi:Type IV secretion system protein virB4 (plasmid) [Xanthomonas hydrangeae]|uniref:VirB4 family type IV secretion/conjugal transfer ATPase n=1 Tax=Xanthomonas hydrangeae TaxID=2775159 RepID=UPI0019654584|nr:Type IV secretion system protein virB4 [Xanthomonas hydrangeae]CAD7741367.1 Type IV secretion system protein virB4 [Xanthomonas hydrangeae]CAD7747902.1 Type IV secretion system protein virB4 [Xanthomonas hydrangeae]CAD7747903.1 Type IV secretion system protein virB4 [Xanthomonas hydrangeae]CAD7748220.1 Type IV secretion system protein virB4 [Xanthomonas hydrangeae]